MLQYSRLWYRSCATFGSLACVEICVKRRASANCMSTTLDADHAGDVDMVYLSFDAADYLPLHSHSCGPFQTSWLAGYFLLTPC